MRGPVEPGANSPPGRSAPTSREAGIAPSMGTVGSAFENAMMESFWGRIQVELFNRRKWKTRIELASAIHDYIELFHNTRRRRSALGMLTPSEVEAAWAAQKNGVVVQPGLASPAPTVLADERADAGLSEAPRLNHSNKVINIS
ncbi:MAG: IS3 family transposase [Solirubrobacteraceae bacterium]